MSPKYYEAYDERYKKVHEAGIQWFCSERSPIVADTITKYNIGPYMKLLELGCGEGRDAQALLKSGYNLLATDISQEAINYCKNLMPDYAGHFKVLDCVNGCLPEKFDFIYAVAVVHMLVLDEDRNGFYEFIYDHIANDGVALICSMGNGKTERKSNIDTAFELQERECFGNKIMVAGTSCRMVNNETFIEELKENRFNIVEMGQTCIPNEFPEMMYVVVKKAN
ncbi:MAG: class I SAM-dependent methyltransferase [Oscillospiraceae bacterium]|nr:class I SAM-dependent methyltransferase [Oscillospiraceae bacterium]